MRYGLLDSLLARGEPLESAQFDYGYRTIQAGFSLNPGLDFLPESDNDKLSGMYIYFIFAILDHDHGEM